ncbi:DUF7594 domain-containing protein [Aeoliella sp.]|uniref:CBM96 family carbohydrate-binding protein n=1 Tax=Aeoliella sp. TaxID=2795800 RepID=UPI003CCBC6E0
MPYDRERLIHGLLDGILSPDEVEQLLARAAADDSWREELARAEEVSEQLAWLQNGGLRAFTPEELLAFEDAERQLDSIELELQDEFSHGSIPPNSSGQANRGRSWWAAAALAACLMIAVYSFWPSKSPINVAHSDQIEDDVEANDLPKSIATLTRTISSDLAPGGLAESTELAVGQVLEFSQGIAEVRFHSGVDLVVSGPAKLRIDGPMAATLSYGRATADVEESAIGFRLDTLDARVIDLGTVFGVEAPRNGPSKVNVFSGKVDVSSQRNLDAKLRLNEGESATIRQRKVVVIPPDTSGRFLLRSLDRPTRHIAVSQDAYIAGGAEQDEVSGDDELLLVKRDDLLSDFNRQTYLQFDLSQLDRSRIVAARLTMTLCPNDIAETKHPENQIADIAWKFEVGGVWDSDLDWSEHHLTWNTAPAHDPTSVTGDIFGPDAPYTVGTFEVAGHGTYGRQVSVSGPKLLQFLTTDQDGLISLKVSRLTGYTYSAPIANSEDRVVHSFASKEHGRLPPPILEVWVE